MNLLKKHNIQFVRTGLTMSEVIDKKIEAHITEVSVDKFCSFYKHFEVLLLLGGLATHTYWAVSSSASGCRIWTWVRGSVIDMITYPGLQIRISELFASCQSI